MAMVSEGDRSALHTVASRDEVNEKSLGAFHRLYRVLATVLDDRARGVDFVCLIIVIEIFTTLSIIWLVVMFYVLRNGIFLLGSIYLVLKQDWIEKTWALVCKNVRSEEIL